LKPWQLNRRVGDLAGKLKPTESDGLRIDFESFPEQEKQLILKASELKETDFSPSLPKEVLDENNKLLNKFFEVIARRVIDLFIETIPNTLCCDELEQWYFKLHFYNSLADFAECFKHVREWPDEEREEFLKNLKENGGTDRFFRFPRGFNERNSVDTKDEDEAGAADHE
jgi:hypothetical protein